MTDLIASEDRDPTATGMCAELEPLVDTAMALGIDVNWATDLLGMPIQDAVQKNLRVPWHVFISLFSEFGRLLEPHGGWAAIDSVLMGARFTTLGRTLGLFLSPGMVYRVVWTWLGPTWFPHLVSTFEPVGSTQFRFTLEIPAPHAYDRGYFEFTRLILAELPTYSGQARATVELEVDGRRATFVASTTEKPSLRAAAKRFVESLLAPRIRREISRDTTHLFDGFAALGEEQSRLRQSASRRDIALSLSGAAIIEFSPETGEHHATPAVYEMFGVDSDRATDIFEVWSATTIESHRCRIVDALETLPTASKPIVVETQLLDRRWLRARINRTGNSPFGRVVATWTDISETRASEAKAKGAAMQFERVLSLSPFAVVVYSNDTRLFANRAFQKLPDSTLEHLIARQDQFIGRDGSSGLMRVPINSDGDELLLRVHSSTIDWEGRPAVLATLEDVTIAQHLVERAMIMDRMAATGTHAAGIAHEINNPLAYVQTNLELAGEIVREAAADGVDCEDIDDALRDALLGCKRIREVVNALRDFSRLSESGSVETDLHDVVQRAVKIVWSEIRARAELTTRDTLDAHAFAQPVALSQAIVALLQNAAQSIPSDRRGHIDISIVESNGEAAITISDDGVGIDPDVMPRVFDPFFTTKRTGDGAGLGLSLARRRIERMGGTLELTSAPESGTIARIRLPLFAFQVVAQ